jgi:hypothetical protein
MIDRSESRLIAVERKNKRRTPPQRAGGNDRPSPQDRAKNTVLPAPKSA